MSNAETGENHRYSQTFLRVFVKDIIRYYFPERSLTIEILTTVVSDFEFVLGKFLKIYTHFLYVMEYYSTFKYRKTRVKNKEIIKLTYYYRLYCVVVSSKLVLSSVGKLRSGFPISGNESSIAMIARTKTETR